MNDPITPRNRGALTVIEPVIERPAAKAQRLMLEARTAGTEQVAAFIDQAHALLTMAREIENGGDAYMAGFRNECAGIARDLGRRLQTIEAIGRGTR
jgi:hypothetical protein